MTSIATPIQLSNGENPERDMGRMADDRRKRGNPDDAQAARWATHRCLAPDNPNAFVPLA